MNASLDKNKNSFIATIVTGLMLGLLSSIFAITDAALIFAGPLEQYFAQGVGMILLGSAIIMALGGLFSSFKGLYAVAQDEPVVIVAVLAASILPAMELLGDTSNPFPTIVVSIGISTLFSGIFFWIMGRFGLSKLVNYIPFPVIAGFMVAIAWLLVQGASEVIAPEGFVYTNLLSFVTSPDAYPWYAAGAFGLILWGAVEKLDSVLAMPVGRALALAAFYGFADMQNISISDLQNQGWLMQGIDGDNMHPQLPVTLLAQTNWQVVWSLWPTFATIALVSTLALLLAASALELSTGRTIDAERELQAMGIANVCASMVGGITGYHEAGLSALNYKLKARNRMVGVISASVCLAFIFLGASILAYIPKALLGGVFIWIALSLVQEWLLEAAGRMSRGDLIAIFSIVVVTATGGFVAGVMTGIFLGALMFLVAYSKIDVVQFKVDGRAMQSNVDRPPVPQKYLQQEGDRILVLKLQGYLFFGRAYQMIQNLHNWLDEDQHTLGRFLILDFKGVNGADSTAITSFLRLSQLADENSCELILTGLNLKMLRSLRQAGLNDKESNVHYYPDVDRGLEFSENCLLADPEAPPQFSPSLEALVSNHFGLRITPVLLKFLTPVHLKARERLIREGEPADDLYLIESGRLSVVRKDNYGKIMRLRSLNPGSITGEMALYMGGTRSASVIADTRVVAWRFNKKSLIHMTAENPNAGSLFHQAIAKLMAQRLIETNILVGQLM
jgi:SulP family sulfate permease